MSHPFRVGHGVHVLDEVIAQAPVPMAETPRYQVDVNIKLLELVLWSSPAGRRFG